MTVSAIKPGEMASATAAAVEKNGNSAAELKDEFLTLMVAQIKNQDPLSPLDGAEYVAQLAQFSTVEGIQKMSQLQGQNNILMDTLQVLQSTQLAGKEVSVAVDRIELESAEKLRGTVNLSEPADEVRVWALGADGKIAKEINLGAMGAGSKAFELPELKSGQYTLEVVSRRGESLSTTQPHLIRTVEKVSVPSDGGDVRLQISGVGSHSLYSITDFLGARS